MKEKMDRLEAMSILLRVVEKGSFSAASRDLRMPLATVSRKVSELESRLGTRLLVRTTRKLALTEAGREEVRSYGGEILAGAVGAVARTDDGRFRVEVSERRVVLARRVIAATGIADELPDIAGLAEHWGVGVIHCPFCHGYEERDRRIVQIVTHPMGLHPAALFRQLTDRLTLVEILGPSHVRGDWGASHRIAQ